MTFSLTEGGLTVSCITQGELQHPRKRPRLLPGKELNEKSKKVCSFILICFHAYSFFIIYFVTFSFWSIHYIVYIASIYSLGSQFRRRLVSVAVDGKDIMAAARVAYQKSLDRLEAKDAAAKAAADREEERVAQLKRIRGERWLPSMAREMQLKLQHWKCHSHGFW